jgi:Fe-S cluster biogenesis protein NfuA
MPKIDDIEFTPNPNAKRFILKEPLTNGVVRSYDEPAQASDDPLASALFTNSAVRSVYYVGKYLTVTQDGSVKWPELERELAVPIRAASAADVQAMHRVAEASKTSHLSDDDQARLRAIEALLDDKVRPALMMDGGGLEVVGLVGNRLEIHYQGACGTCPSSLSGTLGGIEGLLKTIEPDIQLVAV